MESDLLPYLKAMTKHSASDLFLSTGTTARIKVEGKTLNLGDQAFKPGEVKALAYGLLEQHQIEQFEEKLELNAAVSVSGVGRFRINVYRQRGEVSLVARYIRTNIPTVEELNLPNVLKQLIFEPRGLVLVVGATGSGKSTTLASMIEHRNISSAGHILTIEDPIEYTYTHKRSVVDQREVGIDTLSYGDALKNALREAPDVILIGEILDATAMEHAISYADTGHLCLSTLHANSAYQALERIINFFPQQRHKQVFEELSMNLRGIVCQRLLRNVDGKRVPAVEVLLNKPHISELMRNGDIAGLREGIQKDQNDGMMSMDGALLKLVESGQITEQDALANADSRTDLELKLRFGGSDDGFGNSGY